MNFLFNTAELSNDLEENQGRPSDLSFVCSFLSVKSRPTE